MLAGNAIKHEEIAVPAGIEQQLAWLPVEFSINNDWRLGCVPIVGVMRRRLESPSELSCIHVQSNNAGGI